MIEKENLDLVHHFVLFECDPSFPIDDNNLPKGVCDDITAKIVPCLAKLATTWAVGADQVRFIIKSKSK